MPETITPWPYAVVDAKVEAALSEPVRSSANGPMVAIRVGLGPLVTITSMVAATDVGAAVNGLRAGTMWSIDGVTFQFAGELEIKEAQTNVMAMSARFMRV